jgi:hypothetical protein
MTEIYRKRGTVARWENGWLVRVSEAGEAVDDGKSFVARPAAGTRAISRDPHIIPSRDLSREDPPHVILSREDGEGSRALLEAAEKILPLRYAPGQDDKRVDYASGQDDKGVHYAPGQDDKGAARTTGIERLILTEGYAEHECDGIRWSERARRLHVSLTHGPHRALLDLAELDVELVRRVAEAMARAHEREAPESLRLAPHVAAALLGSLIGVIQIDQLPAPHDGRGRPILECRVEGMPPNVWRPSYRVRPVAAWHNLRARPFGRLESGAAEGIALVEQGSRVLLADGGIVPLRPDRIRAIGEPLRWYPYGAGAFGAEMLL